MLNIVTVTSGFMLFFLVVIIQPKTMAVNGTPRIAPASLWTRPKVQEFIQHVKSDPSSVLVVGRGETMTVRVPTHEGGKSRGCHGNQGGLS